MSAPPDWMHHALCKTADHDIFFPPPSQHTKADKAKAICNNCPVQALCLEYALADPTLAGIWGGTSYRDRLHLRRQQQEATA